MYLCLWIQIVTIRHRQPIPAKSANNIKMSFNLDFNHSGLNLGSPPSAMVKSSKDIDFRIHRVLRIHHLMPFWNNLQKHLIAGIERLQDFEDLVCGSRSLTLVKRAGISPCLLGAGLNCSYKSRGFRWIFSVGFGIPNCEDLLWQCNFCNKSILFLTLRKLLTFSFLGLRIFSSLQFWHLEFLVSILLKPKTSMQLVSLVDTQAVCSKLLRDRL